MLPNRHASYSVNLYNSTSSLLANGTGINLFIDVIWSILHIQNVPTQGIYHNELCLDLQAWNKADSCI
jgi:hypothetical protein